MDGVGRPFSKGVVMLHSVKTLMQVGLLMLLPAAADAAVVRRMPEPGTSAWTGSLSNAPSQGRGPSIDPLGALGKVRATSDGPPIRLLAVAAATEIPAAPQ
jgi:hypothetical protein